MAMLWRTMYEGETGKKMLRPGGEYYSTAARTLGLPPTGPLNAGIQYCIPNPLMKFAEGNDDMAHMLYFTYDAAADELVYSHASDADGLEEGDDGDGTTKLSRTSSADQQQQALRAWRREDFLRPECLRPGVSPSLHVACGVGSRC